MMHTPIMPASTIRTIGTVWLFAHALPTRARVGNQGEPHEAVFPSNSTVFGVMPAAKTTAAQIAIAAPRCLRVIFTAPFCPIAVTETISARSYCRTRPFSKSLPGPVHSPRKRFSDGTGAFASSWLEMRGV